MIVPVVFDMSTMMPHMLRVYFNEFFYMSNKYGFPIIANEFYAQKPSEILSKKPHISHQYDQEKVNANPNLNIRYTVPTDEDIVKAWKYVIPDEFCKHLVAEHGGINSAFAHLLTKRDALFEGLLEGFIADIKCSGKPITAFMALIYYPSLAHVAEKHGIKLIHFERGCFRKPGYRNTMMFSAEHSLYSSENVNDMTQRYEKFRSEAKRSKLKLFTNRQILSLFLSHDQLKHLDAYNSKPQYELGCALGWSEDVRCECFSRYNNSELLYTANEAFGEENLLTRLHPGNLTKATYPTHAKNLDLSVDLIEFILKCERVAGIMSNVSLEAAFWGRTPYTFIHCPAYPMTLHSFDRKDLVILESSYLNWYAFCWLVPSELLFDSEYLFWRLTGPSELEVYNRHLDYYLKQDRLPRGILNMQPELSVKVIRHMRKRFGSKNC